MYVALYRKYRPIDFTAVVGQEHITTTLKTEIQEGRVAHAYLFTGTRGTGKTTCARILAKAVNCEHPNNGEPCNECASCRAINEGTMLDVIEIDAASNTGVDNIRDIRDEAVYTPASGRKKVYIIDEVHMLTIGAFNALLKLLEEPPEHVMFILATTEVHKIAPTILSRCQRFDFRRITPAVIAQRLQYVCEQEHIPFTREGLFLIGRLGDGSMRDALSILDTCSGSGQELTADYVAQTAGVTGREGIYALVRGVAAQDVGAVMRGVDQLYAGCRSIALLVSEFTQCMRNLMILKAVKDPGDILGDYLYEMDTLTQLAQDFSLERIVYSIRVLQDVQNTLQRSQNQRVDFEVALMKLCDPRLSQDWDALVARVETLEKKLQSGVAFAAPLPMQTPATPSQVQKEPVFTFQKGAEKQQKEEKKPQRKRKEDFQPLKGWKEILESVISVVGVAYGSLLKGQKAYLEDETVYVVCSSPLQRDKYNEAAIRVTVEKAVASQVGFHVNLRAVLEEEFENMGKMPSKQQDPFAMFLEENRNNHDLRIED